MTRIGKIFFVVWVFLVVIMPKHLFAGSLTASIDKTEGSLLDQFILTVTAEGAQFGDTPVLPQIPGLTISQNGTSQNYSNINGVVSTQIETSYAIEATKEGTFEIPSLTMQIDGKNEASLPLKFVVKAVAGSLQNSDPEVFIERSLESNTAYVGQPILSKVQIFTRVELIQPRASTGNFDSFQKIEIKGEKNFRQVYGKYEYDVIELAEIIVPSKASDFELPSFNLQILFADPRQQQQQRFPDPFGRNRNLVRRTFASKPTTIKILPIPTDGRPQNYSGLVGDFSMSADIKPKSLTQGDTATLTLVIEGKGRVAGMNDPVLNLPPQIKIYSDKPEESEIADRSSGLRSKKVYKYALVPNAAGTLNLGHSSINYFNVRTKKFEDLGIDLGAIQVQVSGEAKSQEMKNLENSGAATKEVVKIVSEDLVGLHRDLDHLKPMGYGQSSVILFMTLAGSSLLFLVSCFSYRQFSATSEERLMRRKNSKALQMYFKNTSMISKVAKNEDLAGASHRLEMEFKNFIGDKISVEGKSLTTDEVKQKLAGKGVSEMVLTKAEKVLSQFDQVNYGNGQVTVENLANWKSDLDFIAKEVNSVC